MTTLQTKPPVHVDDAQAAREWMEQALVHEENMDNYRFAHVDDPEAVAAYDEARSEGCCGFFDTELMVAGRLAKIGCNFGH